MPPESTELPDFSILRKPLADSAKELRLHADSVVKSKKALSGIVTLPENNKTELKTYSSACRCRARRAHRTGIQARAPGARAAIHTRPRHTPTHHTRTPRTLTPTPITPSVFEV